MVVGCLVGRFGDGAVLCVCGECVGGSWRCRGLAICVGDALVGSLSLDLDALLACVAFIVCGCWWRRRCGAFFDLFL